MLPKIIKHTPLWKLQKLSLLKLHG